MYGLRGDGSCGGGRFSGVGGSLSHCFRLYSSVCPHATGPHYLTAAILFNRTAWHRTALVLVGVASSGESRLVSRFCSTVCFLLTGRAERAHSHPIGYQSRSTCIL